MLSLSVWEWQEEAGRKGGSWTTYVNLSDRYVNNATHNYQGIKCVPCINKIMLHWGGKNNRNNRKKGQNIRHRKMEKTNNGERKKHKIKTIIYTRAWSRRTEGKKSTKLKEKDSRGRTAAISHACPREERVTTGKKKLQHNQKKENIAVAAFRRRASLFVTGQ